MQVFFAMTTGTIEAILVGEKQLEDQEVEDMDDYEMNTQQQEKIIEILHYIKRQNILRKQRLDFHEQLRKNQEQRDALEKIQVEEEDLSSETDESPKDRSCLHIILDHI